MNYFENESETASLGNFQVENRVDGVVLSGDITITKDAEGLAALDFLLDHLNKMRSVVENRKNPACALVAPVSVPVSEVPNPF